MRTLLIALSSSLVTLALACGGAAPPAHEPGHHDDGEHGVKDEGDVKENGAELKVGDKTRCPVSGEVFKVAADQPKVEYKGKTYYTCCHNCEKKLKADPEKYIKPKS